MASFTSLDTAQSWTSHPALEQEPALKFVLDDWQKTIERYPAAEERYKDQNVGAEPSALQEVLSAVWASSLGIEKVGIEDDFFELGGASVVATQIVSRLRQMFQMDLPAILLFETPTIEKLARYMIEHEARPGLTEKTAILLKRIEGMTEEEVARSLRSR